MRWRDPTFLLLTAGGSVSAFLYVRHRDVASLLAGFGSIDPDKGFIATYPYLSLLLFGIYAVVAVGVFRKRSGMSWLCLIVGFAVLFRLILVFSPLALSSDLYRYIWDGRVQTNGLNPYLYPPTAEELTTLRDTEIFPHINRPQVPTIYPPAAQMFFALIYAIFPDSISGMKTVMVLGDFATMLLLIRLLHKSGHDANRVLVYAWSPLVIFELAGSGHVEALVLPFILLALLARMHGKPMLVGAALGIATLLKLYPVVLFPALYRKRETSCLCAFGITLLLGYLPYVSGAGSKVLGFLPMYFGAQEDFNVGLRYFLTAILALCTSSPRLIAMLLLTAGLLAVALVVSREEDFVRRMYVMAAAYVLLLPTSFHPWYLVWLVPFLCFYPAWGWLYLSGTISLSYLKYVQEPQVLPLGIRLLEFLPCYALLTAQAVWRRYTAGMGTGGMAIAMENS
jgi:alpha-1,6-mannosyltransferase